MKTRKGFVSNSSSSSYIIIGDNSWLPSGFDFVALNEKQKRKLVGQGFIDTLDEKVTLTQFISDCCDAFYDGQKDTDALVIEYQYGGHGGPYDESYYDEIADNVWMRTEGEYIKDEN